MLPRDQPWDFFGRNDAKAETPVLWPPHAKGWLIGKESDAGRAWGQEEKGMTEDEMAGWHHRLDGCEFEWTLGDDDGQGGLVCCDSWGRKESDMTEQLNWTEGFFSISEMIDELIFPEMMWLLGKRIFSSCIQFEGRLPLEWTEFFTCSETRRKYHPSQSRNVSPLLCSWAGMWSHLG